MNSICEELMLESIKDMDDIDNDIYSESVFYIVDEYIDDYVEESMTNIFSSDSNSTVYNALNDLINTPIKSDESDTQDDSDFTYIDWAPENQEYYDCSEEELRDEFLREKIKPSIFVDIDYDDNYDDTFNDNQ